MLPKLTKCFASYLHQFFIISKFLTHTINLDPIQHESSVAWPSDKFHPQFWMIRTCTKSVFPVYPYGKYSVYAICTNIQPFLWSIFYNLARFEKSWPLVSVWIISNTQLTRLCNRINLSPTSYVVRGLCLSSAGVCHSTTRHCHGSIRQPVAL